MTIIIKHLKDQLLDKVEISEEWTENQNQSNIAHVCPSYEWQQWKYNFFYSKMHIQGRQKLEFRQLIIHCLQFVLLFLNYNEKIKIRMNFFKLWGEEFLKGTF